MAQFRKDDVKMKKFLALIGMVTCILGLTACGSGEEYTAYEQQKLQNAEQYATQLIVPLFSEYFTNGQVGEETFDEYTAQEVADIFANGYEITAEGQTLLSAIESFTAAGEDIGKVVNIGEASSEIDGKQIIVRVAVQGEKRGAEAEIIFSNDAFLNLEAAALNPVYSKGELMGTAAMNTLLGMGTVFAVLILISLIIYCFGIIPKLQKKSTAKEKAEGIRNEAAQAAVQEESLEESDDLELVAVIAAAIAASEGAASADGFVVRSIRRRARA